LAATPDVTRHVMHRAAKALATTALATSLSACIVVPRTTTGYDSTCQILTRRVELQPIQVGALERCGGRECSVILATYGLVAAASAVVSGSIAVIGNVAYWMEEKGRCLAPG
jgi:starvation-inducible outer membrane lipoprotein